MRACVSLGDRTWPSAHDRRCAVACVLFAVANRPGRTPMQLIRSTLYRSLTQPHAKYNRCFFYAETRPSRTLQGTVPSPHAARTFRNGQPCVLSRSMVRNPDT